MALDPPFPSVQLNPREELTPQRMADILQAIQGNFDFMFSLFPLGGADVLGADVARGASETSWGVAGKKSDVITVTHGLGRVPTSVQLTALRSEAGEVLFEPVVIAGSLTKTQFKWRILASGEVGVGIKCPITWAAFT